MLLTLGLATGCTNFPSSPNTLNTQVSPYGTQGTYGQGTYGTQGQTATQPVAGSGAIAGQIEGSTDLSATVSVISGNTTVYQTQEPIGGSFEFQIAPGTYNVTAISTSGMTAQASVTVTANQTAQVNLMLTNNSLSGGSSGTTTSSYCYYYPYYCTGYYPGTGSVGMGKPNIYVSGPTGTSFKLSLKYAQESNLLVATPIHGPQGWSGTLVNSAGQTKLSINQVNYDYLYYDFRTEPTNFQSDASFCVSKSELLPALTDYLTSKNFRKNEINDFTAFWSNRLPPANQYCVYPEENDSIDSIVSLEVTPKPKQITRVWFIIVPNPGQKTASLKRPQLNRFYAANLSRNKKGEVLLAKLRTKLSGSVNRAIASAESQDNGDQDLEVREWGVGFFFE